MTTKLKRELVRRGMPQSELARRTGIREATISNIATGRAVPSDDEAQRIAAALAVDARRLFRAVFHVGGDR